jgi:hypothetical protein
MFLEKCHYASEYIWRVPSFNIREFSFSIQAITDENHLNHLCHFCPFIDNNSNIIFLNRVQNNYPALLTTKSASNN